MKEYPVEHMIKNSRCVGLLVTLEPMKDEEEIKDIIKSINLLKPVINVNPIHHEGSNLAELCSRKFENTRLRDKIMKLFDEG